LKRKSIKSLPHVFTVCPPKPHRASFKFHPLLAARDVLDDAGVFRLRRRAILPSLVPLFEPLMRWLFPHLPQSQVAAIHHVFRQNAVIWPNTLSSPACSGARSASR